jgi:methyl-CpG-binding domain protein 4
MNPAVGAEPDFTAPRSTSNRESPFGLLEEIFIDEFPKNKSLNSWKMLVACILLNHTTRQQVDTVLVNLLAAYPTPEALANARTEDLECILKPAGIYRRRALTLKTFSEQFLGNWSSLLDLHGVGKYAFDAWRLFFKGQCDDVEPFDGALISYKQWVKHSKVRT